MSYTPQRDRVAAQGRGRWAEAVAVLWLRLKGYRILSRGVVEKRGSGAGEIDIVVRKGRVVAFVEVKWRAGLEQAAEAITARQRARIISGASAFLARHPGLAGLDVRFDAVLLAPGKLPRHLPDAWRA